MASITFNRYSSKKMMTKSYKKIHALPSLEQGTLLNRFGWSMWEIVIVLYLLIIPATHAEQTAKLNIMFAFTPSGKAAVEQNVGLEGIALGNELIKQINDTFENNNLDRPFNHVSYYSNITPTTYFDSIQLHTDLRLSNKAWAVDIRQNGYGHDVNIVILFYGEEDVNHLDSFAGQSLANSGYISIRGKFAQDDFILEHELGHELTLDHTSNESSIMSITDPSARTSYNEYSQDIMRVQLDGYRRSLGVFLYLSPSSINNVERNDCSAIGSQLSTNTGVSNAITFKNESWSLAKVYWIDYSGVKKFQATLKPNDEINFNTFSTHPWLVEFRNECVGIVTNTSNSNETIFIKNQPPINTNEAIKAILPIINNLLLELDN